MKKENILLLHGALGSKTQLQPLKDILSENFHVYDLNFEGHGGRPTSHDFSIDLFTENVREFLSENKMNSINVFGYSMGGYVALNFARKYPSIIKKIVTLGTKFNWTPEIAAKEVKMLDPDKIEEKVAPFAKMLKEIHHPNDWKIVVSKTAQMMTELGNGKKLFNQDLMTIQNDALIGIGKFDRMVTIEESEIAANQLPNGQITIVDDFHHPIEKNNMHQLAKIILGWMA